MRLQFYDETGYIELAFFGKYCDLKEKKVYTIRNVDIKLSKKFLKTWNDKNNFIYDLHFNRTTTLIPDPDQSQIEKRFKKGRDVKRQPTTTRNEETNTTKDRHKQQQPQYPRN